MVNITPKEYTAIKLQIDNQEFDRLVSVGWTDKEFEGLLDWCLDGEFVDFDYRFEDNKFVLYGRYGVNRVELRQSFMSCLVKFAKRMSRDGQEFKS